MSASPANPLDARLAAVPPAVRPWLGPAGPAPAATAGACAGEAMVALARAAAAGRPHGGAFDLLAADAWATWACQLALADADADSLLARVLDTLQG